jgi:hypothetical protein
MSVRNLFPRKCSVAQRDSKAYCIAHTEMCVHRFNIEYTETNEIDP